MEETKTTSSRIEGQAKEKSVAGAEKVVAGRDVNVGGKGVGGCRDGGMGSGKM